MKINEIKDGINGNGIYYCSGFKQGVTKQGKVYHSLDLRDNSGIIASKVWDVAVERVLPEIGMYVTITFTASDYNGSPQLSITNLDRVDEKSINPSDYFPTTKLDVEKMWSTLLKQLNVVSNPDLKGLIESFIDDGDFVDKFKKHSAAKGMHHAFVGGLLQHTLFVVMLSKSMATIYKNVDIDLVIAAAFLHDIGKLWELTEFPQNDFSDEGTLLGHVFLSAHVVSERCDSIANFNQTLKMKLIHCLLAHHGKLEFGSPKCPSFAEALIVHLADTTDAKMEVLQEQLEKGTGYNKFLDAYCWKEEEASKNGI